MTARGRAWVRLSRPHFLLGGFLMFGLGAAIARPIDRTGYLVGQLMVTAAQLTAHYANEYADVEADRAVVHRTAFSGGSGVLVEGPLRPIEALRAARTTSLVAVGAALLVAVGSPAAAVCGLAALSVSWAYSMPPVRLLETGWGELAATGVVTGAVPMIGGLTQTGGLSSSLWWAIAILAPVHFAMMLAFAIPDLETDAAVGKRVLAVRIGRQATIRVIAVLIVGSGALLAAGIAVDGLPRTSVVSALAVLPGAVVMWSAQTERNQVLTVSAVVTFVVSSGGILVGVL